MNASVPAPFALVLVAASCLGLSPSAAARSPASCPVDLVDVPRRPILVDGIVLGSISPERVKVATERVEKETGARISPDYADLPRIIAKVAMSGKSFETIAAVVDGHVPQPGDHVGLLSRYRDPRSQCDFIPWTIRVLDGVS